MAQPIEQLESQLSDLAARFVSLSQDNARLRTQLYGESATFDQLDRLFGEYSTGARQLPQRASSEIKRHLIIPVHPPRFGLIVNALSGLVGQGSESQDVLLIVVVTSETERHMLQNYLALTGIQFPVPIEIVSTLQLCKELDLPQTAEAVRDNRNNGIVNFKKMSAIYRSFCLGAEEIVAIDSDAVFWDHPTVVFDKLARNHSKRQIVAGFAGLAGNIVLESARYYEQVESDKIIQAFDQGSLYSWFFDVPYYPRHEGTAWLAHLCASRGGIDNAISSFKWGTFEHLLFQFHLFLRHDFRVVDIRPLTGERIPEELWLPELIEVSSQTGYLPVWANVGSMISYSTEDDIAKFRRQFSMAIHVDRVPGRLD